MKRASLFLLLIPLFIFTLVKNTVILRGAGSLELKRRGKALFIEPVKRLFIVVGRNLLLRHLSRATRGNEKKNMVACRTKPDGEVINIFYLMEIQAGDRRIDLKFNAGLFKDFDPF